jgi:hypothetical protein
MSPPATLTHAQSYHRRGWRLVPAEPGEKECYRKGWPDLVLTLEDLPKYFGGTANIAMILGSHSGGVADVDLDSVEALELADRYLPPTQAVFGRASKPRAHRLYTAGGARFASFPDPGGNTTLLELRADGKDDARHLTLLPPSVADGEERFWEGEVIAPAVVEAAVLQRRCALLAVACLVFRYVSPSAANRPAGDHLRLLWEFDREVARPAYEWLGQPDPDAPRRYPRPRHELTERELDLDEIVRSIPNDFDWAGWNKIGMALYVASGGTGDGLALFDAFSAKSSKYTPADVKERWRNYQRHRPTHTGIGKLAALAYKNGWRPKDRHARERTA